MKFFLDPSRQREALDLATEIDGEVENPKRVVRCLPNFNRSSLTFTISLLLTSIFLRVRIVRQCWRACSKDISETKWRRH